MGYVIERLEEIVMPAEAYRLEGPIDRDGERIGINDTCWDVETGEQFVVASVEWNGVCWSAWSIPEQRHIASKVTHRRPSAVSDVLREYRRKADQIMGAYVSGGLLFGELHRRLDELDAEYAAKLRMAGDAE